jgi:hypothetical protein
VDYYSDATIPKRQAFTSRARVGEFFFCSITEHENDGDVEERIVRVENIRCISGVDILVRVIVMNPTGSHSVRGLPMYKLGNLHDVNLECILQPVHVYAACSPSSACTIHAQRAMVCPFTVSCTALNGEHVHTVFYIHRVIHIL